MYTVKSQRLSAMKILYNTLIQNINLCLFRIFLLIITRAKLLIVRQWANEFW